MGNTKSIYRGRAGYTFALLVLCIFGSSDVSRADASAKTGPWTQAELNEAFMRGLTKHECMVKTINVWKRCDTENCLMTLAGALGDCVTWAEGDKEAFCATYETRYIEPNCGTGVLSENACRAVVVGKEVMCDTN